MSSDQGIEKKQSFDNNNLITLGNFSHFQDFND